MRSLASAEGLSVGKLWFFGLLLLLALVYALPNFFGDDWAVQLTAKENSSLNASELAVRAKQLLDQHKIAIINQRQLNDNKGVLLCFSGNNRQLEAKDILQKVMGTDCTVALSLATRAPAWLRELGADPMRLGLDLRGGVHLLLEVDVDSYWLQHYKQQVTVFKNLLADQHILLSSAPEATTDGIQFVFATVDDINRAAALFKKELPDYRLDAKNSDIEVREIDNQRQTSKMARAKNSIAKAHSAKTKESERTSYKLQLALDDKAKERLKELLLEQTVQIIQNRVNELGVSEAVVQRQSLAHISVDLPGVQDVAHAKEILGRTASLRFQLVADIAGVDHAQDGYESYLFYGQKVALQPEIVLDGSAITYAVASSDQWGKPAVQVELVASAADNFHRITAANVGKAMAVVYSQTERVCHKRKGKEHCFNLPDEKLISVATIRSALRDRFEISGLNSERAASDLALLLRSGSLSAPVSVIHEVTVGPSMGAANIERGAWSLVVGLALVTVFMVVYYGWFGLIADLTLLFNLIFMVAILSVLNATLTMAGMAGMVLTVGMAVDASVLILERIREEMRAGYGGYMSIQIGYQRALATILDSNLSTFIISAVLFSLASGAVKGFAVTLTIGILTSMLTAVIYSKLMTEVAFAWYGRKHWGRRLPIGIKIKDKLN